MMIKSASSRLRVKHEDIISKSRKLPLDLQSRGESGRLPREVHGTVQIPLSDAVLGEIHASADYRLSLAPVIVKRILMAAVAFAGKY